MQSRTNNKPMGRGRQIVLMALLVAQAIILSYFERFIPLQLIIPVPGVRLGLSNIIILTAIYQYRFYESLGITLMKVLLVGMLFGTPITMIYSFSGSMLSFFLMYICLSFLKDKVTPIGISVVGSIFHILGQLYVAGVILGNFKIFYLLPYLILTGVISGILIGCTVKYLLKYVRRLT